MLASINLYVHAHFMDSAKTRRVFGVKVGGQGRGRHKGFFCELHLSLVWHILLVGVFSDETSIRIKFKVLYIPP